MDGDILIHTSQEWYAGEFKDGKFEGKGIMGFANGAYVEIGFKNGLMHGKGTQHQDSCSYGVEYNNGTFVGFS